MLMLMVLVTSSLIERLRGRVSLSALFCARDAYMVLAWRGGGWSRQTRVGSRTGMHEEEEATHVQRSRFYRCKSTVTM